jgi:prevent-host-death family protein
MAEVGLFDAKSRLSELVERALAGESVVITRRGVPAVRLVPVDDAVDRAAAGRALVETIRREREGRTLGPDLTIRQLIDEGRR